MSTNISQVELRHLMAQKRQEQDIKNTVAVKKKKKKPIRLPPDFFSNQRHKVVGNVSENNEKAVDEEPMHKKNDSFAPIVTSVVTQSLQSSAIPKPQEIVDDRNVEEFFEDEDVVVPVTSFNRFEQNRAISKFAREASEREDTIMLQEQISSYKKIEALKKKTQQLFKAQENKTTTNVKNDTTISDDSGDDSDLDSMMGWSKKKTKK
ncbi:nucleoside triphosphatase I [Acrasis kona]|uniref:Nucleoside triphosphatase I n=1 Tax=Acrasis kona TaxID=1008807 RepID=A0AAW2ZPY4_9EUKA